MTLRLLPQNPLACLGLLALVAAPACADDATPADDTGTTGDTTTSGMTLTGMTTAPTTMTVTGVDDTGSSSDDGVDTTVGEESSSTGGEESSSTGGEESSSTGGEESSSTGGEESSSSSSSGEESSSSSSGGDDDCGNGVIDGAEDCDGDELGAETCQSQDFPGGGTLACADDCTFDTSACLPAMCGNGVLEGDEACDGTDFGDTTCADFGSVFGALACDRACAIDSTACTNTTEICATPDTAIGPNVSSFVESLVTSGEGFVTDIDVFLDANHTWVEDLDIQIRHGESAAAQFLLQDQCGNADNVLATFDQDAAAPPACAAPPAIAVEGTVLPDGDLAMLTGAPAGATWELVVADDTNLDGGTLNEWCVSIEASVDDPVVCGDAAVNFGEDCDGGVGALTCADVGFADGTLACDATTCLFDTSGCFDVCGDGDITGNEDCDGSAIGGGTCESEGFVGGALDCDPVSCEYEAAECSDTVIAMCAAPGTPFGPVNITSVVTLTDVGTIGDIDVRADITHPFSGDIALTLVNEAAGISVVLVDGLCGSDDHVFATFNDEAAAAPDCDEPIGIEGNVLPDEVLSAFDGAAIAGDWTLQVVDTFPSLDNGTLNQWCVYITPE